MEKITIELTRAQAEVVEEAIRWGERGLLEAFGDSPSMQDTLTMLDCVRIDQILKQLRELEVSK